ncbi:Rid family hydrolase [Qaidamihabitans albus]|uniref:Rid family hydrolase n=1 Tax=Qaidamihabitans albus TaxID=2795733 RepID=UPI0018F260B8|nr:Rid family hydrolase [Qaidamihabitans albus]
MSSAVDLVRTSRLSDVAEYAYASRVRAAGCELIFAAGACPLDAEGNTVAVGDYAGQARQAMRNLRTALAEAGAALVRANPRSGVSQRR